MSVSIDKMGRPGAHCQAMETDLSGGGGGGGVAAKKRGNDRKRLQNMEIMKTLVAQKDDLRGIIYDGASCAFFAENLDGLGCNVATGAPPHTQRWLVSFKTERSHLRDVLLQLCDEDDGGYGDAADGAAAAGLAAAEQNGVRALSLALQQSVLDAGFVRLSQRSGRRRRRPSEIRSSVARSSWVVRTRHLRRRTIVQMRPMVTS